VEKQDESPAFEEALEELEAIVERMEDGEPSLEESLKLFERGMDLTRSCQKALDDAEQRIRILADAETGSPTIETDAVEDSAPDG
jgi:exodeoxyribonuclease VII small subunit